MSAPATSRAVRIDPDRHGASRLVGVIWALLIINTLGSAGGGTIIPIPTRVAQLVTMGALGAAFVLALLLNPRVRIRPSAFLLGLSLLLVESCISSAFLEAGWGALIRCARLALFIVTLWLLTPWWNDGIRLVRQHVKGLSAVLASVLVGLLLAPGLARPATYDGRLVGVIWYLPPPRVAEYAAVAAGLAFVLWLGRCVRGRDAVTVAVPAVAILLLTHTRTATVGLVAGVLMAALTLLLTNSRARRTTMWSLLGASMITVASGTALQAWFRRGQGSDALSNLTGRADVWDALLAAPRTLHEQLFGIGLSDKSFGGLPIDSSWLAVYQEQGLIGVGIVAAVMAGLLVAASMRPPTPARACSVFLIVYCAVASYTEVGIGDASTYLLHLTVAAALLTPAGDQRRTEQEWI